jgi:hypothetical protein
MGDFNNREVIAIVSILLYGLLGLLALHYYLMVRRKVTSYQFRLTEAGSNGRDTVVSTASGGINNNNDELTNKFNAHSQVFFLVLFFSAVLDIPIYIGCIGEGGPIDCEWDNYQYSLFLGLHFVSLCGYFYCLGVPLFLWAEVFADKGGGVRSVLLHFDMKLFLYLSIACYTILQFIRIVGLFTAPVSDHISYQHTEVCTAQFPCFTITSLSLLYCDGCMCSCTP